MRKPFIAAMIGLLIVVILAWLGFSIYRAQTTVDINPIASKKSRKINGEFDTVTLNGFTARVANEEVDPDQFHVLEESVKANLEEFLNSGN